MSNGANTEPMSSHFTSKAEIERKTSLSHLLDPRRPRSPAEQRFVNHAYCRAALVLGMLCYFVYCNPEYSYTYTALRRRYGWDKGDPLFPQYFKFAVGGKDDGRLPLPKSSPPEDARRR